MSPSTPSSDKPPVPGFLQVAGEMSQRTREYDWSRTPIGPVDTWPQSLRTAVGIVLRSRFPMFIWWGDQLIQFYNDAYRPSLGNDGKHPSALGQRGEDCWPEIWPVIYPLIRQVREGGDATWSEDQLIPIYRNGRLEDVYWTFGYSAIPDEHGAVGGVLVVCHENTEKMVHYQKIVENESQLSFAIDAAELGTWDYSPLTNKFSANERLKDWFGLQPNDLIELPLAIESMTDEDRPRVVAAIQRALQYASGGYYDIIYTIVNKYTAQQRIVRAKGRAWFNDDKVAYRFNGTLQDITEQETARIKLQQAEEKVWLAIGTANLGTYEIDLETEQITSSDRFNIIWGMPPTKDGKKATTHIHPDDIDLRIKAHLDALTTGYLDYEVRVSWPDQSLHWVRLHGKVLYDNQGKAVTLLGVIQDITEQNLFAEELGKQVRERTLELQRSNDDLLQFAHVITHDLKEPLRKVKIFNNRILDELGDSLPQLAHNYLARIKSATQRMSAMIEGVLNYSSISASNEAVEAVDLNETLEDIKDDLEVLIQQKNARIIYDVLPTLQGAPVLLYQLFYNIVNNSLKFSKKDLPPVITLSATPFKEKDREMVRITVADNGIGFDPEHQESVFHSFTRLNSKDRFEGTGLGLALSKKITERHGGTITAIGEPGKGARIIVTLPIISYLNQHI
ncbi:MAG TPA: ATP-binding protein [Puia sp.]